MLLAALTSYSLRTYQEAADLPVAVFPVVFMNDPGHHTNSLNQHFPEKERTGGTSTAFYKNIAQISFKTKSYAIENEDHSSGK